MCPQHKVSTTVDALLMWTLLARPLGVHIRGTLLYLQNHEQERAAIHVSLTILATRGQQHLSMQLVSP